MNEDLPAKEEVLHMLAAMQPPDTQDLLYYGPTCSILACPQVA